MEVFMEIIKRLCSVVLSSAILLTSADLSSFLAKSVNVPQNIIVDGNESVSENNEDYQFIDESEIENYENFEDCKLDFSGEKIIFDGTNESDIIGSDEQSISKNDFKYEEEPVIIPETVVAYDLEPILTPEAEFAYEEEMVIFPENEFAYEKETVITPETEFAYDEEKVITPETEFEYEEEPINYPEDSIMPNESDELNTSDNSESIEESPIDLSEYNFDNVIDFNTILNKIYVYNRGSV